MAKKTNKQDGVNNQLDETKSPNPVDTNSKQSPGHYSQKLSAEELLETTNLGRSRAGGLRKQSSILGVTNNDFKKRVVVAQDGLHTLGRSLAAMAEDMANRPMSLPFGDISHLKDGSKDRIATYLSMIAMRAKAIPSESFSAKSFIGDDEITMKDMEVEMLNEAYDNAKTRFIAMQIIQPLLRDILVTREGVSSIFGSDPVKLALKYASWVKAADNAMLRIPLMASISGDLEREEALAGFVTMKDGLINGMSQSAMIGLPLLVTALHKDERSDSAYRDIADLYSLDNTDDGFIVKLPSATIERSTLIYDVNNNPLWIGDSFTPAHPSVSYEDIAALISLYAELQSISIVEDLGVEFMSRYPSWSGLLMKSQSAMSDEVNIWFNNLCEQEFIRQSTNLPSVDTKVMALFNEPNRSDLHVGAYERIYFVALAHSVVLNVLSDILGRAMTSVEYKDLPVWSEINKILPRPISPIAMSNAAYKLDREYDHSNVMSVIKNGIIKSGRYYVEQGIKLQHPVLSDLTNKLERASVLSYMNSNLVSVRPFSRSGSEEFCYTSNLGSKDFFHLGQIELNIEHVDEFYKRHDIQNAAEAKELMISKVKKRAKSLSTEFLIIGKTSPLILTRYNIPKRDVLTYTFTDIEYSDFDLQTIYDARFLEGWYRIFLTKDAYHYEQGESLPINTEAYLILPELRDKFKDILELWEHDLTPNS